MQLAIQTDMFSDIPVGYRYWTIQSNNPVDGNWVCVTAGGLPDEADVKSKLGFTPSFITEVSREQAIDLFPRTSQLPFNEYAKGKRGKRGK